MRILIFGDVHWSTYSSILRTRGLKYSSRLENLIASLNWVEETATKQGCKEVICLGDFFDRSDLTAEEISALQDVVWSSDITHHFIVGNHEANISSLIYNSTNALNRPNFYIEDKARKYAISEDTDIYFLPYIIEDNRESLKDYLSEYDSNKKHLILSHNDLKGVRYGVFESQEGFLPDEIESACDLFINGHLHNGAFVNDKKTILNLGNLTGQNFGEDAFNHAHNICILDTDTFKLTFIENPFAYNFYKIVIQTEKDLDILNTLKKNAVVSFKCLDQYVDKLKEKLNNYPNIIESKTVIYRVENIDEEEIKLEIGNSDYLEQFTAFMLEKLGKNDIVLSELTEVCK